jgi:hypothetical protein
MPDKRDGACSTMGRPRQRDEWKKRGKIEEPSIST